ncbi:MAG: XdhC family protein [Acidobacteriota bacterium]
MHHELWHHIARALTGGRRGVLALVVDSTAHSPGTTGAGLFVDDRGERIGTIGGGVMEKRVVDRAMAALSDGETWCALVDLHHRRDVDQVDGERSGMICAGRQTNLYRTLDIEDGAVIAAWLDAGSGRLVVDSIGGLSFDPDGSPTAAACLERHDEGWSWSEPAVLGRRLAVLGGGHCGQALGRLMRETGWAVSVWETRSAVIDAAELEGIRRIDDFRDAGSAIDHPERTAVVIMTTDVPNDVRALAGALSPTLPFPFVGVMGSSAKLVEIRRRLLDQGVEPAQLDRLVAPVGVPIGSDTPQEIAISVAAQLIARCPEWLDG